MFEATLDRRDDEAAPRSLAALAIVLLSMGGLCCIWAYQAGGPPSPGLSAVVTPLAFPDEPDEGLELVAPAPPASGGAPAALTPVLDLATAPVPDESSDVEPDEPPPLPDLVPEPVADRAGTADSGGVFELNGRGNGLGTGIGTGTGDGRGDGEGGCPPGQVCDGASGTAARGPRVKRRVEPRYPDEARRLGLGEQLCTVEVAITAEGRTEGVDVSGCPSVFHDSARAAFFRYRWYPAKDHSGERTASSWTIRVRYRLR